MSTALRTFIRTAMHLAESDTKESPPTLNPFASAIDDISSTANSVKNFVISVFGSGFTNEQKLGVGEGSIIGSKVSIAKDAAPAFVVLCKMQYAGKEYLIAKKYSKAGSFDPVPGYGSYLDPNVLINGTITALPDANSYKIKKEIVVVPAGGNLETTAGRRSPLYGRRMPTADLIRQGLDPQLQKKAQQDGEKQDRIRSFDTAVNSRKWVKDQIGFINGLNSKLPSNLASDMRTLEAVWKIFPTENVNFKLDTVRGEGWLSIMTAKELFENEKIGLFEFNPASTVYPPPYSYTVEGIIDRIEGDCPQDAKEYITKYSRNIAGDLDERDQLNLAMCSNQIAGSIMLNLVTVAFAVAGGPAAPVVIAGSLAIQGLSLLQLMTYQLGKDDKKSAVITAARFLFLFIPFVKMKVAYDIIANIMQLIADIIGSGSVDAGWIKSLFNRMGLSDDDTLASLPEAIDFGSVDSQLNALPLALEENRIYRK